MNALLSLDFTGQRSLARHSQSAKIRSSTSPCGAGTNSGSNIAVPSNHKSITFYLMRGNRKYARKSVAEHRLLHTLAGLDDERVRKGEVQADMVRAVERAAILPADARVPAAL